MRRIIFGTAVTLLGLSSLTLAQSAPQETMAPDIPAADMPAADAAAAADDADNLPLGPDGLNDFELPRTTAARTWAILFARRDDGRAGQQALAAFEQDQGLSLAGGRTLRDVWSRYVDAQQSRLLAPLMGDEPTPPPYASLVDRLSALARDNGHNMLVMELAASIGRADDFCDPARMQAMAAGASDVPAALWHIAEANGDCPAYYRQFVAAAPDRAFPALLRSVLDGGLSPRQSAMLAEYILSRPDLDQVNPEYRDLLRASVRAGQIGNLLLAGDDAAALDAYWRLSAADRPNVLPLLARRTAVDVQLGGLLLHLDVGSWTYDNRATLLFAAIAQQRSDIVDELFPRADRRVILAAFDCMQQGRSAARCMGAVPRNYMRGDSRDIDYVIAAWALDRPQADPFDLLVASESQGGVFGSTMPTLCSLFTAGGIADPGCAAQAERGDFLYDYQAETRVERLAMVAAARLEGFVPVQQAIAAEETRVHVRTDQHRPIIDPAPSGFAEIPIPHHLRGHTAAYDSWPRNFTQLSGEFMPVRLWRDGRRVAVVSQSQKYDPTGEVTGGAYWIHISEDGGRSWQPPLYTGLAVNFPYEILADARMPLLQGDVVQLAVNVRLIDTSSIMYPPVATRIRTRRDNLYLSIPLAALRADSDGDGWSDIAERRLFDLPGGQHPFVIGSDAQQCAGRAPTPMTALMGDLIAQNYYAAMDAAIIVPPHDGGGDDFAGVPAPNAAGGGQPTVLMVGDAADFACLHAPGPILVYSSAMVDAIRNLRPDFQPVRFNRPIMNRAGDKAIVHWTTGGAGGSNLFLWVDGQWQTRPLSQWVS